MRSISPAPLHRCTEHSRTYPEGSGTRAAPNGTGPAHHIVTRLNRANAREPSAPAVTPAQRPAAPAGRTAIATMISLQARSSNFEGWVLASRTFTTVLMALSFSDALPGTFAVLVPRGGETASWKGGLEGP
jgi:hypothetical protein